MSDTENHSQRSEIKSDAWISYPDVASIVGTALIAYGVESIWGVPVAAGVVGFIILAISLFGHRF